MSFNEAAALRRGKHIDWRFAGELAFRASMRPRPYAAENCRSFAWHSVDDMSFNEAAALRRGKPAQRLKDEEDAEKLQ